MRPILTLMMCILLTISEVMADTESFLRGRIAALFPELMITKVEKTALDGLYQVFIGTDVIYITEDGNYIINGEIFDVLHKDNMTEHVRSQLRLQYLNQLEAEDYIEFPAEDPKTYMYVFTDISCGYCRKLHNDVPELNTLGVSVRYLAYPRNGEGSAVWDTMQSIWCADDRQTALTMAKNGQAVAEYTCKEDLVKEQYELGALLGVRGTPALYLQDGRALPGYMAPDQIVIQLLQ